MSPIGMTSSLSNFENQRGPARFARRFRFTSHTQKSHGLLYLFNFAKQITRERDSYRVRSQAHSLHFSFPRSPSHGFLSFSICGQIAQSGTRTRTLLLAQDFKSCVSTIPPSELGEASGSSLLASRKKCKAILIRWGVRFRRWSRGNRGRNL